MVSELGAWTASLVDRAKNEIDVDVQEFLQSRVTYLRWTSLMFPR